ncbi:DNA-binding transcriptional regulator, MerR family [Paenibacillus sp. cl141a]|uniref:MerR family transcriptional regulator n=1 Tax=Paenibacillus sp. cl141a TaxID=1761877 RepID=UPI0008C1E978|nr:MerR family transcriptional regulator [Paenibacillus sp. cl141a]SEL95932.1 DNA-binding transcriptional regulator, MerR family [Paenibacillus sp. cl141a]
MAFTIKEASERLGCPAHTIRFYEKEGLLPYIKRDKNGNRLFEQDHLDWIRLMTCFRATGMKLSLLKEMVDLALDAVNNKLSIYEDIEKRRIPSESQLLIKMEESERQ